MAVTKGHGNPDWARDEVLLALDLYFGMDGKIPGPTDERVVALSETLRSLPIHAGASKNERFRNPDGVAFKLQNLRQVATGRGLGNVSSTDKAVWADFGGRPELVRELAARIRAQGELREVAAEEVAAVDEEEEFFEGRVLTTLHKVRERAPKLRKNLLAKRRESGQLACDACGEGPKVADPKLSDAGFEAHHLVPLAQTEEGANKLKDMALLCATCHRLIHRAMHLGRGWVGLEAFRKALTDADPSTKT